MSNPDALHLVCPSCNAVNRIPQQRLGDQPKCGKCHAPIFSGHPVELNAQSFQPVISRNDVPVLVDFWAEWCAPCKMMAPAFHQAAQRLEPNFRLAKLNTETAQQIAAQYQIRSIPTLALFKGGREIARQAGAMQAEGIIQWALQNNR